ncbi:MAG: hypothetical protein AB7O66_07550 [Limisphaerales bacterium]
MSESLGLGQGRAKPAFQYESGDIRVSVPTADEPRVKQFGPESLRLAWLRSEQRESGRWWMHSLCRGNYPYITYIATAQALKAFDFCGELPVAATN